MVRASVLNYYYVLCLSRIFDKDDDGFLTVEELRHIMQSLGEKCKTFCVLPICFIH